MPEAPDDEYMFPVLPLHLAIDTTEIDGIALQHVLTARLSRDPILGDLAQLHMMEMDAAWGAGLARVHDAIEADLQRLFAQHSPVYGPVLFLVVEGMPTDDGKPSFDLLTGYDPATELGTLFPPIVFLLVRGKGIDIDSRRALGLPAEGVHVLRVPGDAGPDDLAEFIAEVLRVAVQSDEIRKVPDEVIVPTAHDTFVLPPDSSFIQYDGDPI
jgi:hypothetical protein